MMKMTARTRWMMVMVALLALTVGACTEETAEPVGDLPVADPEDSDAPLSDLDALLEGSPDSNKLPSEAKADQVFPANFDIVELQSPVKSQGSRGVCSIFSTAALMEHLYIKEGTLTNPDFSEQFLQWSAKFEAKRFQHTGGSNASANLTAISNFGIVDEQSWPYQSQPWGTSDDERCEKDNEDKPTICYTNGEPPQSALDSKRWNLPRGRFVSSRVRSIKAVIHGKQTGVVTGLTFFYQSWNHRKSKLPTNRDYWSEGYVLPPNDEDRKISLEKRAGHSILLVGWDDNLEVPVVDEAGKAVLDAEGNEVMEKGFFLFKNSWGTSGFGIRHPSGAGYGWIAYSYVEEFGSSMTAAIPVLDLAPEICDDGKDNNEDRQTDCEDPQCANDAFCLPTPVTGELSNTTPFDIPDNDRTGITSTIEMPEDGFALKVSVDVEITHPFIGDLIVTLTAPDGTEATLHNKTGRDDNDIKKTFDVSDFNGTAVKGIWSLTVVDTAAQDEGTLSAWALTFDLSNEPPDVGEGELTGESDANASIPDNDEAGISDIIAISGEGTIDTVSVGVDITHPFIGDLLVTLVSPSGTEVPMHEETGGGDDNLVKNFTLDGFKGESAKGDWTLKVSDNARSDEGTLNSWILDISVQ